MDALFSLLAVSMRNLQRLWLVMNVVGGLDDLKCASARIERINPRGMFEVAICDNTNIREYNSDECKS